MKFTKKKSELFTALLVAVGSSSAQASPVDLSVTGLIQPASCQVTLGSGGVIDLGTILHSQLRNGEVSTFTSQNISMDIACNGSALFSLTATDNRAGTADTGITAPWDVYSPGDVGYGLGTHAAGKNIGTYTIVVGGFGGSTVADGLPAYPVLSDDGVSWQSQALNQLVKQPAMMAFSDQPGDFPIPIRNLSSYLAAQVFINSTSDLDLSNDINLDGSATLEIAYL